jgi:hypothetical protein
MTTPRLPPALKALRASLRSAQESALRERLSRAIRGLELLYGLRTPAPQDDGDLRRHRFVADRHPAPRRAHSSNLAPTDDEDLL